MRVYVNGKETEVGECVTMAELIAGRGLNPDTVVVEHNLNILKKPDWPEVALSAEDKIEIIAFVGGG